MDLNVYVLMVILKIRDVNHVYFSVKLVKTNYNVQNVKEIDRALIVHVLLINLMIKSMFYASIVSNIALFVKIKMIANNVILIEFLMDLNVLVNKAFMRVQDFATNVL